MHMADIIVALIILAILGAAIAYIYRAKKSGAKCIGCPAAGKCASHHGAAGTACHCHDDALAADEPTACSCCEQSKQ